MERMTIRRCVHCMGDMAGVTGPVCPHCGRLWERTDQPGYCLRPFTILHGKYLVGRMLGRGGFGITYIGLDLQLESKVAIKECFPSNLASRDGSLSSRLQWSRTAELEDPGQTSCESFLREARRMARMKDIPEVVRVQETFEENSTAYIVMDFVEGITMKQLVERRGPLAPEECLALFRPLIVALGSVHRQGFIHRDISPDNIMLEPGGKLRLLDLGAAREFTAPREGRSQQVTKDGYSPLEQYSETGRIGPWTDIYALSATMVYCLTGRGVPPSLDRLDGEPLKLACGRLSAALQDGLALEATDRIRDTGELLRRLDGGRKRLRWERLGLAAALTAGLGLIASGLILGLRPEPPAELEVLGSSNSDIFNYGGFAIMDRRYEYIMGPDEALYVCEYDPDQGGFLLDDARKAADNVGFVTLGEDRVYFSVQQGDTYRIVSADPDGTDLKPLYTAPASKMVHYIQYAAYSDGGSYLYFAQSDSADGFYDLWRLELPDGEPERVEREIAWYNLDGPDLFYTVLEDSGSVLYRAAPDGSEDRELERDRELVRGVAQDGVLYMWSLRDQALEAFDRDGELRSTENFYDLDMDLTNRTFACADGWIYYVTSDGNVRRARDNGTGDELFLADCDPLFICCSEKWFWMIESDETMTDFRTLLVSRNGGEPLVFDTNP